MRHPLVSAVAGAIAIAAAWPGARAAEEEPADPSARTSTSRSSRSRCGCSIGPASPSAG